MPMYSFVKNRKIAYIIASILFLFSVLSPFLLPFHQWIDLTGGVQAKYSVQNANVDTVVTQTRDSLIQQAKQQLSPESQEILTDFLVYRISGSQEFMVEIGVDESKTPANVENKAEFVNSVKDAFFKNLQALYALREDGKISESQYVNIGASFGQYIKNSGYIALSLVAVMISVYIMYAFAGSIPGVASWPFAFVTGLSLVHDVVVSFGLYVVVSAIFPAFKIDIFLITAMLTVLGYSINDTIVILDRVRNTIAKNKKESLENIIDNAIRTTMRRSLFTSLTILIVLVSMFLFGPESIHGFLLAMIFGTIVGTWSSIFLAAPALIDLVKYDPNHKPKPQTEWEKEGIVL